MAENDEPMKTTRRIGCFEILGAGPNPGQLVMRGRDGEPFVVVGANGMTVDMVDDLVAASLPENVKESIFADQCEDASGDWSWRHLTEHERIALARDGLIVSGSN